MCAADDSEANCATLFSLGDLLRCAGCGLAPSSCAPKLFSVCENEIHVLVESQHLSDHLPAILKCDLHAIVDKILHLSLSVCRRGHDECSASEDGLIVFRVIKVRTRIAPQWC